MSITVVAPHRPSVRPRRRLPHLSGLLLLAALAACDVERSSTAIAAPDETAQVSAPLAPSEGSFSTFTYNVAGLPQVISSAAGDRAAATALISCYLKRFDVVNVQEDFNYHAALYDSCDDHPYRSTTSGGVPFGSGLNTLSRYPYIDWERVSWKACNGVDCLTPKGFTLARVRLAEGVFVDVYNAHTQAQTADADLDARRKDVLQLLDFIEANSAGNAVLVMGDTNTRYTREGDNIFEFTRRGFRDVWVDLVRGGVAPTPGAPALTCDPAVTSPTCEVVDKILYRDNGFVGLQPTSFAIATDAQDAAGVELSDHRGLSATWRWSASSTRRLSDAWGGPHGVGFNDVSLLPASPEVRELRLRSGSRVDRVETLLWDGTPFGHGGTGGTEARLTLAPGEHVTQAQLCSGQHQGHTRIFYAKFTTDLGRTLAGGSATSDCTTYTAPAGWQVVAFHGRSAEEVDRLGMVYAPVGGSRTAAPSMQLVNRGSGLCLDASGGTMGDGTALIQWSCHGGANQRWRYDAVSGLIRSAAAPHLCLDNSGRFENGSKLVLWTCSGNAHQRFALDAATGTLTPRTATGLAVEALLDSGAGGPVQTWASWGGANQRWQLVP